MTTNSHSRGSAKSHSRVHKKEDDKINGTVNDDVMLQQCYKEIALLEYWLGFELKRAHVSAVKESWQS